MKTIAKTITIPQDKQGPYGIVMLDFGVGDGIAGKVLLNGTVLLTLKSDYLQGGMDISEHVKDGINKLSIVFDNVKATTTGKSIIVSRDPILTDSRIALDLSGSSSQPPNYPRRLSGDFLTIFKLDLNPAASDSETQYEYTFSIRKR